MVLDRMDKDSVEAQLKEIVLLIETEQISIDASFEKLLIAVSNVLRLTNGQKDTLASLQGTSKDLQGYIIDLVSQIRKKTSQTNERLVVKMKDLMTDLE